MKQYAYLSLGLLVFLITGCTGPVIMGGDAAVMYLTKPGDKGVADTKDQIAQHETWCYSTMGESECFSHPQDVQPNRLINVDPQSRYPLDAQAYRQLVVADRTPVSTGAPASLIPASSDAPASLVAAPTVGVEQDEQVDMTKQKPSPNSTNSSKMP